MNDLNIKETAPSVANAAPSADWEYLNSEGHVLHRRINWIASSFSMAMSLVYFLALSALGVYAATHTPWGEKAANALSGVPLVGEVVNAGRALASPLAGLHEPIIPVGDWIRPDAASPIPDLQKLRSLPDHALRGVQIQQSEKDETDIPYEAGILHKGLPMVVDALNKTDAFPQGFHAEEVSAKRFLTKPWVDQDGKATHAFVVRTDDDTMFVGGLFKSVQEQNVMFTKRTRKSETPEIWFGLFHRIDGKWQYYNLKDLRWSNKMYVQGYPDVSVVDIPYTMTELLGSTDNQ